MKTTDNGGTFQVALRQGGGRPPSARWRWRPPIPRWSGWAPARPTTATARAGATACTGPPTAARPGPTCGLQGQPLHRAHRGAPHRSRHGLGGGDGRPLDAGARARALQDDRRGQDLDKVLTAAAPYDDRVGSGDVVIDPQNPSVLYAALYARRRTPWSFTYGPGYTDGKDLGGIFKSTDGGATWRKLEKGLPGAHGRIGLGVSAKDPRIVYAIVQSDDGGQSSIDQVRSRRGRRLPVRGRRGDLDAHQPAQPAAVLLQPDPRGPRERPAGVGAGLRAARLGRRRPLLPRGPLRQGPPRLPRPGHRPAAPQAHGAGHGRRGLPEPRRGQDLGAPQPLRGRRVLPDQRGHEHALPDLRRPAGQPELGGPQPHVHQGRHPQQRLDQHRRRRRVLLRVRPREPEPRLRGVAGGLRVPHGPRRAARRRSCGPSPARASPPSASTGTRRSSAAGTRRARCTWRATACSS